MAWSADFVNNLAGNKDRMDRVEARFFDPSGLPIASSAAEQVVGAETASATFHQIVMMPDFSKRQFGEYKVVLSMGDKLLGERSFQVTEDFAAEAAQRRAEEEQNAAAERKERAAAAKRLAEERAAAAKRLAEERAAARAKRATEKEAHEEAPIAEESRPSQQPIQARQQPTPVPYVAARAQSTPDAVSRLCREWHQ